MFATVHASRFQPGTILDRVGSPVAPVDEGNRKPFAAGAGGADWSKKTSAGTRVTEDSALSLGTVLCCVRVLAESIAATPLELYWEDRVSDEIVEVSDHRAHQLVRWQPNNEWSAYELWFGCVVDMCIRGFGCAQILRDEQGELLELWPLSAAKMSARRAPDNGRLVFVYAQAVDGKKETLLEADEVLLTRVFPHGGLLGSSLIRLANATIGASAASEDYSNEYFANGVIASGVIQVPGELSEAAYTRLKQDWTERHSGRGKRHGAPLLEGGATFNALSLSHEEAQLLETRKFQRSEIAGLFRVPAHLIGDLERSTFSNIEHTDLAFVKHSLRPWFTNIQQRCRMALLADTERALGYRFEYDLEDLQRGDFPSRVDALTKGITGGVFTSNDARRRLGENPVEGGDTLFVQGALRPITEPYHANGAAAPAK